MSKTVWAAAMCGTAAFTLTAVLAGEPTPTLLRAGVCGGALTPAALIDLRDRRIPNRIVLPASATCALLAVLAGPASLRAAAGPLLLVAGLLALAFARPSALGMGDVKAALLISLALGPTAIAAMLFGLAIAALAGLTLIAHDGHAALRRPLPLAPFLTIGALAALAMP